MNKNVRNKIFTDDRIPIILQSIADIIQEIIDIQNKITAINNNIKGPTVVIQSDQ
jgi:hypothetical protein